MVPCQQLVRKDTLGCSATNTTPLLTISAWRSHNAQQCDNQTDRDPKSQAIDSGPNDEIQSTIQQNMAAIVWDIMSSLIQYIVLIAQV
jgi:hypothetical protein